MRKNLINILGVIIYRILLDVVYIKYISVYHDYIGFINSSDKLSLLFSWCSLLIFIPVVLKLYKKETMSANILVSLFMLSYVPMTSLMCFLTTNINFFFLILLYWFTIFLSYDLMPSFKYKREKYYSKLPFPILIVVFVLCGVVIFISGYYFNFRISLDLANVYELRYQEKELNVPSIFHYLLPAASNIIPVILVFFIDKRNKIAILIFSIILLLNFSIGGHKSILFKLLLCYAGYLIYDFKKIRYISWFLAGLVFLGILEFTIIKTSFVNNFVVRRVLFVPGLLDFYYYDFFSINEADFFRQGILRRFGFDSPYSQPIAEIIGFNYFHDDTHANNGLFSDAYANMKFVGVLFFPFILSFIFKLFDWVSTGIHSKYLILPILVCATSFNSGFFTSVLLTNGVIILMFVLYFFPRIR